MHSRRGNNMNFAASRVRPFLVLSAALAMLLPVLATAAAIEEVIVTAQKRDESIQDVGISISAFSARQLEQLGIKNSVDIAQQVPGLHLFTYSPAFTVFSLRGVSQNNFQDNLEAPVAVYLDGSYIASMNALNMQLFDMNSVEVLRGPQGTLFGRNATGGVIQFLTHKAVEAEANGYLQAIAADFNSYSLEGAFGGQFKDGVRGRLSGRWEKSDGYVEPGNAFGIQATGRDTNGADGYALRGNLQIDASDNVLVDLSASYAKDDDVPTGVYIVSLVGIDPNTGLASFNDAFTFDPINGPVGPPADYTRTPITGDGFHHFSASDPFALSGDPKIANRQPFMDREIKSATGTITADLEGGLQLVSITNWMEMDKFYVEDSAGGLAFFPYNTINSYDQVSEELRLAKAEGGFRWQIGAYYLDMKWDTFQSVQGAAILGGTSDTQKLSTLGVIDSKNWSVFGQAEFDIAPAWTMILGARWSQDDKDLEMRRVFEDVPQGVPPTEVFNVDDVTSPPDVDTIDYGDWAGRAQLNWKPSDDALIYVAYNRGIKGGNWSLDPLGVVANISLKHDPEKLNAYEVGFKTDFLEGSARLNGAVYFYDYKDYQAFSILNLTPQVTNSDAESKGGELEFSVAPAPGLNFMIGAAYIDSEVEAVPDVFGGVITDVDFPTAPELSFNVLGRYEWPALGGQLAIQLDGQWNDDQFLEGSNSNASFESSYSVWNGRLSYATGDKGLGIDLWVKNFTDEEYRIYNLDLGLIGFIEQVYAPPRQYGVTLSYRW